MRSYYWYLLIHVSLFITNFRPGSCLLKRRQARSIGENTGRKGVNAALLNDEIDLKTILGIEQATKLVLIKTDSLPGESDDVVDGRYLNSLMETLYTGLGKPFKSVSADILGILPTFEEIQVNCARSSANSLEKDETLTSPKNNEYISTGVESIRDPPTAQKSNDTMIVDNENYIMLTPYKSSVKVCRALTNDCLSMEELVDILPATVTTFDKVLVRLCPVILFRIMNHICQKPSSSLKDSRDSFGLPLTQKKSYDEFGSLGTKKESVSLNTLLRETQILKNIQNSDDVNTKKPQKLHKKLKTQTPFNSNERLNAVGLQQQHGSVDEQLLKIRLKLTEPSIEKVWIFSLLFVILSIVVSMGGLIVLPFVKKTTRRRILTLFEGLAVGGLSGSATLHMFPQAFGLVDENYHKYFWRIFVVFFGIYLCYLCERIIKIFKVMRVRMERRSRASLIEIDMDLCYGLPPTYYDFRNGGSRANRLKELDIDNTDKDNSQTFNSIRKEASKVDGEINFRQDSRDHVESRLAGIKSYNLLYMNDNASNRSNKTKKNLRRKLTKSSNRSIDVLLSNSTAQVIDSKSPRKSAMEFNSHFPNVGGHANVTRHRLKQCLNYVQRQFSPVYAVQTPVNENVTTQRDETRANRLLGATNNVERVKKVGKESNKVKKTRVDTTSIFKRVQGENKNSMKKCMKQRDIETVLYHRSMDLRHGRSSSESTNQRFLQQRLSTVSDVAAERQDQDNAARMSVDTVAWMIVFGDAVLNVIDGLSIGAAFERNILAGISISVAVMLEEVTHRLGTFAVLIRAGMSMQQSLLCTFLSACALFPGLIVGILLSDATEDATPYIFCAAGGIFLYMALVDVMKEMNRSIENAIRKDIKSTLQIFALQNVGIILAVIFLSFLALYEQAMDFEEYQLQYNQLSNK